MAEREATLEADRERRRGRCNHHTRERVTQCMRHGERQEKGRERPRARGRARGGRERGNEGWAERRAEICCRAGESGNTNCHKRPMETDAVRWAAQERGNAIQRYRET